MALLPSALPSPSPLPRPATCTPHPVPCCAPQVFHTSPWELSLLQATSRAPQRHFPRFPRHASAPRVHTPCAHTTLLLWRTLRLTSFCSSPVQQLPQPPSSHSQQCSSARNIPSPVPSLRRSAAAFTTSPLLSLRHNVHKFPAPTPRPSPSVQQPLHLSSSLRCSRPAALVAAVATVPACRIQLPLPVKRAARARENLGAPCDSAIPARAQPHVCIVDTLASQHIPPQPHSLLSCNAHRTPQRNREFLSGSFFSVAGFYGEERAGVYGEED